MEQNVLTTGDRSGGRPAVLKPVVRRRMEQIRRYLWVVVALTVLAVGAAAYSALVADAGYTAKSALVVSSPGRSPEQDAVLAVGYATLFNDPATIARLRAVKAIPDTVDFEAITAAASPIVTVAATAGSPQAAQEAAQMMAEAFRDDMNSVRKQEADATVADLQRQIGEMRARPGPGGALDPAIGALQESINNVQYYSTTNQLQDLQMRVGVVQNSSKTALKLLLGLIGGLIAGGLSAFALAALSNRLTSAADVREKTGIQPLAELPGRGSGKDGLREERLRTLANVINARSTSSPLVIAVTDTRGVRGAQQVAEALSIILAQQGRRTVLVLSDTDTDIEPPGSAGFNDALRDNRMIRALLRPGEVEALSILTAGSPDVDRHVLLTRQRLEAVLEQLRLSADVIIVAAPSISETPDAAQLICAAADSTVLVISKRVSLAEDVLAPIDALSALGAEVAGAVLLDDKESGLRPVPIRTGSAARHRSWIADPVKA